MTMYTKDGERIVSVERFMPLLKSFECGEKMVLHFKNNEGFQYAIRAWKWLNEDETHKFILLADGPGCDPDGDRVPYLINDVDYDEKNFVARLYGTKKTWKEAAHTFDLEFGSAELITDPNSRLGKRLGNWGVTKSMKASLKKSFNGNMFDKKHPMGRLRLDCTDCGTSGTFHLKMKIRVHWAKVKEVSLTVQAKGVRGDLGLRLRHKLNRSRRTISISQSKRIFQMAVAGFDLKGIGHVGIMFKIRHVQRA